MLKSHLFACACTAFATLITAGNTMAGSESFSDTFSISLQQVDTSESYIAGITPNRQYRGTANPTLSQFDTLGGTRTLDEVIFNLEITFQGEVYIYQAPQDFYQAPQGFTQSPQEGYQTLSLASSGPSGIITPIGWSSLLTLRADADFDPLIASGNDNFFVTLDEYGEGTDSAATDLSGFIGSDTLEAFVCAMIELSYPNKGSAGNAGNAGNEGLTAFGIVEVIYNYSELGIPSDPIDPTVIPTPSAFGMGVLTLLGLVAGNLVLRRRVWGLRSLPTKGEL